MTGHSQHTQHGGITEISCSPIIVASPASVFIIIYFFHHIF